MATFIVIVPIYPKPSLNKSAEISMLCRMALQRKGLVSIYSRNIQYDCKVGYYFQCMVFHINVTCMGVSSSVLDAVYYEAFMHVRFHECAMHSSVK